MILLNLPCSSAQATEHHGDTIQLDLALCERCLIEHLPNHQNILHGCTYQGGTRGIYLPLRTLFVVNALLNEV